MDKGQSIHRLVQSLELNEKRYFKLQASVQKKESNLSRLFDFYAEIDLYSEDQLKARFEGEKFVEQLAVTQNHLYDAILRTMRSYHLKHSEEFRLSGMLQDVNFLYQKGLNEQAELLLKKVKKIASNSENRLVVLRVIEWEAKMLADRFYADADESEIDRLSDEYYEVLGILQNEREYAELQSKIFNNYYKIGVERANSEFKTNEQIMNQFALKDESRAITFRSQLRFYNIHAQFSKINGDWEKALHFRNRLIELCSSRYNEMHTEEALNQYLAALNNVVPILLRLRNWNEVKNVVERMNQLQHSIGNAQQSISIFDKVFLQTAITKLCLYTSTGAKELGLKEIDALSRSTDVISRIERSYLVHHLHFNGAYFLFTIGQSSPALRWLNKIVNSDSPCKMEDLNASIRILSLLAQFEIGRNELLDYLAKSTKRYLNKLEGLYKFEEIILDFMKRVSKNDTLRHDRTAYVSLRNDLAKVGYEPGDRNELSTIDLIAWVDSKINGIPMWQQLKSNNENK